MRLVRILCAVFLVPMTLGAVGLTVLFWTGSALEISNALHAPAAPPAHPFPGGRIMAVVCAIWMSALSGVLWQTTRKTLAALSGGPDPTAPAARKIVRMTTLLLFPACAVVALLRWLGHAGPATIEWDLGKALGMSALFALVLVPLLRKRRGSP